MDINKLLKVELHLHLDCSLSYKVVSKIDPSITHEYYLNHFVSTTKCTDLADFIERAGKGFFIDANKTTIGMGCRRHIQAISSR